MRLPEALDDAMAWFAGLAADAAATPDTRLAAVVQRARCAPELVSEDLVASAIRLLRKIADAAARDWAEWHWLCAATAAHPVTQTNGAPPHIVAAFEDMDRRNHVHAPTTGLLHAFHDALGARVAERTALRAEQLSSPDPGSRLDAVRMSGELMKSWRGDHAPLIIRVAEQLDATSLELAAKAAAVLEACHPIVACLDRMGRSARPVLPQIRAELMQTRRGDQFISIEQDEELQRLCRAIIARLT